MFGVDAADVSRQVAGSAGSRRPGDSREQGPEGAAGFPTRVLHEVVLGVVGVHENFARSVVEVKQRAIGVGGIVRPAPAVFVRNPFLDIHLVKVTGRIGDGTGHYIFSRGLSVHLNQTHRDAADWKTRRVLEHAQLAVDLESLEEKIHPRAETDRASKQTVGQRSAGGLTRMWIAPQHYYAGGDGRGLQGMPSCVQRAITGEP